MGKIHTFAQIDRHHPVGAAGQHQSALGLSFGDVKIKLVSGSGIKLHAEARTHCKLIHIAHPHSPRFPFGAVCSLPFSRTAAYVVKQYQRYQQSYQDKDGEKPQQTRHHFAASNL